MDGSTPYVPTAENRRTIDQDKSRWFVRTAKKKWEGRKTMKLTVKGEDIVPYGGGLFSIRLTPEKMREVYVEQKRQYMAKELAQAVKERIAAAGVDDRYANDWPARFGEKFSVSAMSSRYGDDAIRELHSEAIRMQVDKGLEICGIDPDTMLPGGEVNWEEIEKI